MPLVKIGNLLSQLPAAGKQLLCNCRLKNNMIEMEQSSQQCQWRAHIRDWSSRMDSQWIHSALVNIIGVKNCALFLDWIFCIKSFAFINCILSGYSRTQLRKQLPFNMKQYKSVGITKDGFIYEIQNTYASQKGCLNFIAVRRRQKTISWPTSLSVNCTINRWDTVDPF